MNPLLHHLGWQWAFLGIITVLLLGAMATVGIGWVKVKMLPFDNKSEFQVILTIPEGSSLERTARAAREMAAAIRQEPEMTDYQIYVGVASPFNFNGLVRHYFLRRGANVADIQVNLVDKHLRAAQSHDIAKRVRPAVAAIAERFGARVAVAEVPPGPPVLQTLVAEIYGPTEDARMELAGKVKEIFRTTPGVVDIDAYVEADQPKTRFINDKEKAALHGISAETISPTLRIAVGGESVDLLHIPQEKDDVNLVLQLPRSARTRPEDLLALRVRSGDANALPEPGTQLSGPPLVPLRELVRLETGIADKSRHRKNLMSVTYVIGDVAGVVESPVYAIAEMNRKLEALSLEGSKTTGVTVYNASMPFTDAQPAMKRDGELAHHPRGVPGPGPGIRCRVGPDLSVDGRVVPVVSDPADRDGRDTVLTRRHPAGPRGHGGILHGDVDDRLHGRCGDCGKEFHHPGGLHRAADPRGSTPRPGGGRCRRSPVPSDGPDCCGGDCRRGSDPGRPIFQGLAISLMAGEVASLLISRMAVPILYFMASRRQQPAA